VVLVTGASSGIGRATALRLAKQGAHVIALGRDRAALEDAAGRTGGRAIVADVGVAADVDRAVAEAHDTYGRVDVLVNNAGFGIAGPFVMTEPEEAERLIRVNLLGAIQLTGALLPGMIERGRGHVVNVSSIAGHVGVPDEAVFAATKAGLIGFTESLRYELAGSGVGMTLVSPGVVKTAFFQRQGRPYHRSFPRPIRADRVARAIVRSIRKNHADVFVPGWMAFPAWLHGTWPTLYRRLAGRYGH